MAKLAPRDMRQLITDYRRYQFFERTATKPKVVSAKRKEQLKGTIRLADI